MRTMWISRQIAEAQRPRPAASSARISGSGAAGLRSLPFAGPWGVAYLPPDAAQAVLVETNEGTACIGTVAQSRGIRPGELLLYSAGGAEIYLRNNGEIEINGQVFHAKGGS